MGPKPKVMSCISVLCISDYGNMPTGLGLHLQHIAQQEIPADQHDLHEPTRLLSELTKYEHLHHLLWLCIVHILRNIKKAKVSKEVKEEVRSLACIRHPNFEHAIQQIQHLGEKAGQSMSSALLFLAFQ